MNYVVDASATLIALTGADADQLLRKADRLYAPDLIVAELLNARWNLLRREAAAPDVAVLLAFLERVELVSSVEYAVDADILARQLDHPIYDCLYAAVARRVMATFITADRRFARKMSDVETIVVGNDF